MDQLFDSPREKSVHEPSAAPAATVKGNPNHPSAINRGIASDASIDLGGLGLTLGTSAYSQLRFVHPPDRVGLFWLSGGWLHATRVASLCLLNRGEAFESQHREQLSKEDIRESKET